MITGDGIHGDAYRAAENGGDWSNLPLGERRGFEEGRSMACTAATPKTVPPDGKVTSPVGAAADNDGVTVAVKQHRPANGRAKPDVTSKAVV